MSVTYLPPHKRPRPEELARVRVMLDWKEGILIQAEDEAALGRIFAWLQGQIDLAGGRVNG